MRFECDLPASTASLAELRARFGQWLAGVTEDLRVRSELVLALSELATVALNDVEASDGSPSARQLADRVVAAAWTDETGVAIEVATRRSVACEPVVAAGDLAVVATITDALRVREENGWRHVGAHASVSH